MKIKTIQCDVCGNQNIKIGALKVKMYRHFITQSYVDIDMRVLRKRWEKLDICSECSDKMMTWIRKEAKDE